MDEALRELIAIAGRHARGRRTRTAVPRVTIGRSEVPTPPLPELCQPTALFVLQGTKSVLIGDRTNKRHRLLPGRMLINGAINGPPTASYEFDESPAAGRSEKTDRCSCGRKAPRSVHS
ncbi:AraC family transcriptional regulator N-terminal domain-containing protein [Mesorhizobium sp.]|nr:AraC family transcriptional regulator N-terminal domain-containing protein [Mesorhizobium sp.]